ncbi:cupin domain-containing protein [Novosphingobium sp.]|uniref:cupin domain-containing protein n=1 Tax=Novosphingobium sp. TaxID=1874826 RepID=UPI003BAD71ED
MTTTQGSVPESGPSSSGAGDARWQAVEARISAMAAARPRMTVTRDAEVWFSIAPGVQKRQLYVDADAGWESFFLKLEPGAELAPHRHTATEEGLVLSGEVMIDGEVLREGDLHIAFAGHDHGLLRSEIGALLYIRGPLAPLEDLDLSDPLIP